MVVVDTGSRYEARASYEQRHVLKECGWRWDGEKKTWWTDSEQGIFSLRFAGINVEVMAHQAEFLAEIGEDHPSRALDGPRDIPAPPGMEYLPFQRGGIAFARGKDGILLADDMGLGKTVQAIGVLNDAPVSRVLVVCPASLRLNWAREIDRWLNYYLPVKVVDSGRDRITDGKGIVIINYDLLKPHHPALVRSEWDMLIVDECQYVKSPTAKRTKLLLGDQVTAGVPAKRRIFISGTPLESRPVELWPVIHSLWPKRFPSYWEYAIRYCNARQYPWGWDVSGSSNTGELQSILRNEGMVRRRKSEVLKDLPPKVRHEVVLPCVDGKMKATVENHKRCWEDLFNTVKRLREGGADYNEIQIATNAARSKLRDLTIATSRAKLPMALEFLENAVATEGKVVCFAFHHETMDEIIRHFGDSCVAVSGRVDKSLRQDNVDRFQNDPECKLFVGQLQAAGVGLTLTAASHVAFVEFDWRPGVMEQAEDRLHRIGQTDSVTCSYLVIDGSVDEVQLASLDRKSKVVGKILNQ